MKFYSTLFFIMTLLFSTGLMAQTTCDGDRYINDGFTPTTKTTVKFGENTTVNNAFKELYMDIYEPEGDLATKRPVVILAFGGSFIAGNRESMASYCQRYASKGYVAVTIDYRLFDKPLFPFPDSLDMMEEVVMAIADMKAAIRFLRKDAATTNLYRIDSDFIFVGGLSAGGIVANHVGFVSGIAEVPAFLATIMNDQGGFEGNTDDPANSAMGYSSKVQGVVSFFGALYRAAFVSSDDPPIVSIHGDEDGTVPYQHGTANVFGFPIVSMDGSGTIHPVADAQGVTNHLITVPGGGHGDFMSDPFWADSIFRTSALMMEDVYCSEVDTTVAVNDLLDVSHFVVAAPNPAAGDMTISVNVNKTFDLLVFDNMGRLVRAVNDINNVVVLNSTDFAAGFYHASIRFHDDGLAPVMKKLVFGR